MGQGKGGRHNHNALEGFLNRARRPTRPRPARAPRAPATRSQAGPGAITTKKAGSPRPTLPTAGYKRPPSPPPREPPPADFSRPRGPGRKPPGRKTAPLFLISPPAPPEMTAPGLPSPFLPTGTQIPPPRPSLPGTKTSDPPPPPPLPAFLASRPSGRPPPPPATVPPRKQTAFPPPPPPSHQPPKTQYHRRPPRHSPFPPYPPLTPRPTTLRIVVPLWVPIPPAERPGDSARAEPALGVLESKAKATQPPGTGPVGVPGARPRASTQRGS